jgi:hypothetical protein
VEEINGALGIAKLIAIGIAVGGFLLSQRVAALSNNQTTIIDNSRGELVAIAQK